MKNIIKYKFMLLTNLIFINLFNVAHIMQRTLGLGLVKFKLFIKIYYYILETI